MGVLAITPSTGMVPVQGIEPQPTGSEPDLLPLHHTGMVLLTGVEPALPCDNWTLIPAGLPFPHKSMLSIVAFRGTLAFNTDHSAPSLAVTYHLACWYRVEVSNLSGVRMKDT